MIRKSPKTSSRYFYIFRKLFALINIMQWHECNNRSFSRILFYYTKNLYIYIYNKITLHYLQKRRKPSKGECNTWIWWISEKKFYTPNLGCYNIQIEMGTWHHTKGNRTMFQNGEMVLHLMVSKCSSIIYTQVYEMLLNTHLVYGRWNGEFFLRCQLIL
jgi:hypothetical protein